jgi:hypothetical protein
LYLGYVFGTVPASLFALIDWLLTKWLTPFWRGLATGVVSALGLCGALAMVDKSVAIFGLIGLVSGAVCSWLSGYQQQRAQ